MTHQLPTLVAALALALALPNQAGAEPLPVPGFKTPGVITLAYRDPASLVDAAGVLRQGGFAVAGTVRWLPAAADTTFAVAGFAVPAVVGAAYHQPSIATTAVEVRRQGGFATAGTVRWRPAAPTVAATEANAVKLGAL